MPGNILKYAKYIANGPYPEPEVEGKNIFYANLLLEDYAGMVSELTAINLYIFQHIVSEGKYGDFAELIGGIAMAEMKHLELLGDTIKLLGVKPVYANSTCPFSKLWTAKYVNFTTVIKAMIAEAIRSEKKAINQYKGHIILIKDEFIKKLINRIIVDEELHLKLLEEMYEKY
ncbi:ferritin-like domain-containing protein [Clostridium drakei]|uniref:Rubrerythrin n=1 Tax=Clostridium drakei TaxID=332101 RepID=A0A2U8DNQ8_9CLOT|nr:manganese catalase family protein [Clostridium drakei]AWI04299.1 rubrerythrin [Clostridium drakei]